MPQVINSWNGSKITDIRVHKDGINIVQQGREYIFPLRLLIDTSGGLIQFRVDDSDIIIEDGRISVDNKKLGYLYPKNSKITYDDILKLIDLSKVNLK